VATASFDSFLEQQSEMKGGRGPFWALDFDDEEKLLQWLNAELDYLKEQAQPRILEQRKNLATFRGIRLQSLDTRNRDEQATENLSNRRSKNPRVIYNHMVDFVEQHVARLTKYRGAVGANPATEDDDDRKIASVADELVEKFWEKVNIDAVMQKHHRRKRIMSENYIAVLWNNNLGPYDSDYLSEAFKKLGIKGDPKTMNRAERRQALKGKSLPRIAVIDPETGEQVRGSDGLLWIERPMRRGDVQYKQIMSWDMYLQRKSDYEDVEMGTWREWVDLDTLKALHPKKAGKISVDSERTMFDLDTCEDVSCGNKVEVFHTYHKSTDLLDGGRYVKWCKSAILKNRPNDYCGWDDRAILPWVRTVDIDTPAVLNGDATVTHGRGPLAVYNNLVSMKVRNRFQFSHPKWFYPRGTVKIESLTNDKTLVAYKGAIPPALVQPAINEANESQQMAETKNDMQQIMGVYGISRGEPPKGVTAAVALTYLDEKENERENPGIQAHTDTLRELALQTLWIMADHYGDDAERLEELLGKSRAYQIKDFQTANLRNISDLRIQNESALPQQKGTRMQFILDLKEKFPNVVPDDVAIDTLGLAEDKRLRNMATVAVRKAEDENESLTNGAKTPAPIEGEQHLVHYRSHRQRLNEPMFVRLPKKAQDMMRDHLAAHEMMMLDAVQKNPQYLMLLQQEFPDFPLFFTPEPPPAPMALPDPGAPAGMPIPPELAQQMPPQPAPDDMAPIQPGAETAMPPPPAQSPGAELLSPVGV
jgi:hypothetical protein